MSNELAELDQLIESDVLEALGQEVSDDLLQAEAENPSETSSEETETEMVEPDGLTSVPDEFLEEKEISAETPDEEIEVSAQEDEAEGEVLDDIGDIEILPMAEIESALEDEDEDIIEMNSNDANNLATILSKLLNNKTIEITIKVKD